jgi:long-chain fatty acid transport protein
LAGIAAVTVVLALPAWVQAQGLLLTGVGPVNRSMGGAATACPIDAAGAIQWNPATISGLPNSEMLFGCELILPTSRLSSEIQAGAMGPGFPPVDLAGSTRSECGIAPVPAFAYVHKPEQSPWTYGIGLFGIGGFTGNCPASSTNPILTPPPPIGLGVGRIAAQFDLLQLAPTVSCALSENLSIGLAPTVTMGKLIADPAFFASPDDANGDGFFTYPSGTGTKLHWGAGFQVGLYYAGESGWRFGAAVKSPQWFEPLRFNVEDELGRQRLVKFRVDYPMIVSVGAAYAGWQRTLIACDLRYIDYANTDGFRSASFDPTGAATGLGWRSVLGVSLGLQRELNDRLAVRLGYEFNENPISNAETSFNLASPLIIQHWLSVGLSYGLTANSVLSLVYVHGFENDISGPIVTPFGPLPGTTVTSQSSLDSLGAGITLKY